MVIHSLIPFVLYTRMSAGRKYTAVISSRLHAYVVNKEQFPGKLFESAASATMEIGSVMEVWDDVATDGESNGSDVSEDIAAQELGSSSEDEIPAPSNSAGSSRTPSCRGQHVDYNWDEIVDGKHE